MKIGIIGITGFIGKAFIEKFGYSFEEVRCLVRSKPEKPFANNFSYVVGALDDAISLNELIENIDILLHFGFDHTYRFNISGMETILQLLSIHNVNRLIYLSSYIVYDLESSPYVDEESNSSKSIDIYTREKIVIEKILKSYSLNSTLLKIINIQPTIVFGYDSSWSNHFIMGCKFDLAELPSSGENPCPVLYIDDLIHFINLTIHISSDKLKSSFESFIISGIKPLPWKEMYLIHLEMVKKLAKPYGQFKIQSSKGRKYGNSLAQDLYISLFFLIRKIKFLNFITSNVINIFKNKKNDISIQNIIEIPKFEMTFKVMGLSKVLHNSKAIISITKAHQIIGYSPKWTVEDSIYEMINKYNNP